MALDPFLGSGVTLLVEYMGAGHKGGSQGRKVQDGDDVHDEVRAEWERLLRAVIGERASVVGGHSVLL